MSIHFALQFAPRIDKQNNRGEFTLSSRGYLHISPSTYYRLSQGGLDHWRLASRQRDIDIIKSVSTCKFMTSKQIMRLYFKEDQYRTPATAHRMGYTVLDRLIRDKLLRRIDSKIGGLYGGSSGYVYSIGHVGVRLITKKSHVYYSDPISQRFVKHTLAISDLYVSLHELSTDNRIIIKSIETEPSCWKSFLTGYGRADILKPDMFVKLLNTVTNTEYSWFVELDRGTTHRQTILNKAKVYERYYFSGNSQTDNVFPGVTWIVPDEARKHQLEKLLEASNKVVPTLHRVVIKDESLSRMTGLTEIDVVKKYESCPRTAFYDTMQP